VNVVPPEDHAVEDVAEEEDAEETEDPQTAATTTAARTTEARSKEARTTATTTRALRTTAARTKARMSAVLMLDKEDPTDADSTTTVEAVLQEAKAALPNKEKASKEAEDPHEVKAVEDPATVLPEKEDPATASTASATLPTEPHLPPPFSWPTSPSPSKMKASPSCSRT
jgi:hypothetical protein